MRRAQVVDLAKSGNATTFITLTCNPAIGYSPAGRARSLVEAWRQIVKRACKRFGIKHIAYLCVFEATKRGEPHLHILARVKYIPQPWLSAQLKDLTGAGVVDIREVKSARMVANYMAKYVGKEPHRFATCKRYWCTQSWRLASVESEPEVSIWTDRWYTVNRSLAELRRLWVSKTWDVAMEGHILVAMATGPPEGAQGGI